MGWSPADLDLNPSSTNSVASGTSLTFSQPQSSYLQHGLTMQTTKALRSVHRNTATCRRCLRCCLVINTACV